MSSSPDSYIRRASNNYDTIGGIIASGIGGTFLAAYASGINVIQAIVGIMVLPLEALGINLAGVVTAFVGGGAQIIQQGAQTTVASIAPGATWAVGPLTFAFGIIAASAGLYTMAYIVSLSPTSNLIPFSFTDFPLVGADEGAEEFEE